MKLADRMKIARECEAIVKAHGASVEILPRGIGGERETLVTIKWLELCASFDIGDGGVLVSFFNAARPLRRYSGFDHVNPYHRRKASTELGSFSSAFMCWLTAVSADIQDGKVFAP